MTSISPTSPSSPTSPQIAVKQIRCFLPNSIFKKLPKKTLLESMKRVIRGEDPAVVAASMKASSASWLDSVEI